MGAYRFSLKSALFSLVISPIAFSAPQLTESKKDVDQLFGQIERHLVRLKSSFQVNPQRLGLALEQFRTAQGEQQRYYTASTLAPYGEYLETPELSASFNEAQRALIREAQELVKQSSKRAQEFEALLRAEDIMKVTRANPSSVYRHLGKVAFAHQDKECDANEYRRIRKAVGFAELHTEATIWTGPYMSALEAPYLVGYAEELQKLLREDRRFLDYQDLADTYYDSFIRSNYHLREASEKEVSRTQVKDYEDRMVESGVKREEVRTHAFRLAKISPACFASMSLQLTEMVNADYTMTKGRFFLNSLKDYVARNKKAPETMSALVQNSDDRIFGNIKDGYQGDFVLEKSGSRVTIKSLGRSETRSSDDLEIGSVEI